MRDLFLKDWGWKFFSLLLAVAIWLTVHNILNESAVPLPAAGGDKLTYDNVTVLPVSETADVHDFHVTPPNVAVTISGPHDVIAILQANQIRAVVDLTGFQSPMDLNRRVDVLTPPNVTILKVDPPTVLVVAPVVPAKK